jgi:CheY-like chemotaxis protein
MPRSTPSTVIEILLVEDNEDDAELMADALNGGKLPAHVTVVRDGVEAMQLLRREGTHAALPMPQLILLDLHLPRMNGREVLREMKQNPILRLIPIVIMTSSQCDQEIIEAYELHANCCVRKPLDLEAFVQTVATIERFWLNIARRPGTIA